MNNVAQHESMKIIPIKELVLIINNLRKTKPLQGRFRLNS